MKSMHVRLPFGNVLLTLSLILGIVVVLVACGGGAPRVGEGTPAVTLQAQLPTEVAAPGATQEPAEVPGAGQEAGVPSGSGLDACTLVTKEEAEAALGKQVDEPTQETVPMMYACTYEAADFDRVDVLVVEYNDEQEAAASFQMELDINDYEEISGVGDRALRPWPIMDITVLSGQYEVSIDISDGSEAAVQLEKARNLAEKALGRLP